MNLVETLATHRQLIVKVSEVRRRCSIPQGLAAGPTERDPIWYSLIISARHEHELLAMPVYCSARRFLTTVSM
jgi:hypothetical protein